MQKEAHEFMIKQTIIMECIQKGEKSKFMQSVKKLTKMQVY